MSFFKKIYFALTKKERLGFLVCSAIAGASFVVIMGILIAQATTAIPTQGGNYAEGMLGQPEYVNPVTAQSEIDLALVKLIYQNVDDVADNISASPDGLTWTVHLKDGVTWQDGQQLTSDDIIFTVQSIQNQGANSPLAASWQGVTVNRVSELELTFTLSNPYAFFGDNLANLYIVPKHIFADVPVGNWRLSDYNLRPIGSGPYKFVSYGEQQDGFISSYQLVTWNGYSGNQPLIPNLAVNFYPNSTSLINAFNAGAIDGFGGVTSDELTSIERPYDVVAWPTPSYYAVFFNTSKNLALQDNLVREALSLAVDRDALVSNTLGSYGSTDYGPIPPSAKYYSPTAASANASTTPSSISAASALLQQDGWVAASSSAFRAKTIGKTSIPLEINLTVPDISFLIATAQTLQADWQSIGVATTIATDTPANIVSNDITNRAYESLLFGNVLGPSSDLYSFWDSSQRFPPGLNLAIYDNPNVDRLIENARENLSDASRTIEYATAQTDIINDNPAIFLYSPDYLYVSDKSIQGISPSLLVDPSDLSRAIPNWYLNTARVLK
jgi:peptide/nickel transport system substrate-binding protein